MSLTPMGTFTYSIQYGDNLFQIADRYNVSVDSICSVNPGLNPNNLMLGQLISIPIAEEHSNYQSSEDDVYFTEAELSLYNLVRMLFEQHINGMKIATINLIYDLPELDFVIKKALRNPVDFSNLFRTFFGDEVANQLRLLITDHLLIGFDIVKAKKVGDQTNIADLQVKWFKNVEDIALLFSEINDFWEYEIWKDLLTEHINLLSSEINYFLGNKNDKETVENDLVEYQALSMADYMIEGLISGFPESFE